MESNLSSQIQNTNKEPIIILNQKDEVLDSIGTTGTLSKNNKSKRRFMLRRKQQALIFKMDTPTEWKKALKTCGTGIAEGHHDYTKMVVRKDGATLPHTNLCKDWNCPYCTVVKSTVYGNKIKDLTEFHLQTEKRISFITVTAGFKHSATTKERIDVLQVVFNRVMKSVRKSFGPCSYVKRIEFTINQSNGKPHIHIHSLLLHGDEVNCDEQQSKIAHEFMLRWEKHIRKEKIKVSSNGQKYLPVKDNAGIASYISKTIGMEMTSSITKKGKGLNWFDFLEADNVFTKEKKERIIRDVINGTMGRRLISFSQDLNACYKELERQEDIINGATDDGKEEQDEIEMLTSTANVLLKLHLQQGFSFIDNQIFTEDILHFVSTLPKFRTRFEMICRDTIEMRQRFTPDDEIVEYFLINLEELLCVGPEVTALPSPTIH